MKRELQRQLLEDSDSDEESYMNMGNQDMEMVSEQGGRRIATNKKSQKNMIYSSNTESDLDDEL